jgi:hypothetical protein
VDTTKTVVVVLLVIAAIVVIFSLVAFVVSIFRVIVELAVLIALGWIAWHLFFRNRGSNTSQ